MIRLILLFVCLWISTGAYAVRVTSIYQAKVPVASQSAADRAKVLNQGLAQVIVKASGNRDALENPTIKAHLKDASTLMQAFGYSSSSLATYPYLLEIQFDADTINKLLQEAGVPIWGANRPLIVGWFGYEEPNHAAIIDATSASDLVNLIKTYADQRGLPIILPMMDVTDLNVISIKDIQGWDVAKIQAASQRYTGDAQLMVRLLPGPKIFSLQAKLVMGSDQWQWNIAGPNQAEVIKTLINHLTDTLAGRYAAVVTNTIQDKVTLKITAISEQDDFDHMLNYIQHLPQVASVEVDKIEGPDVSLSVSLRGTRSSFTKALVVGKKMSPLTSDEQALTYQWNR